MNFLEECIEKFKEQRIGKKHLNPVAFLKINNNVEKVDLNVLSKEIALRRLVKAIKDKSPSEVCFAVDAQIFTAIVDQNMQPIEMEDADEFDDDFKDRLNSLNDKEALMVGYENADGKNKTLFLQVHSVGEAVEFLELSEEDFKDIKIPSFFDKLFDKVEESKAKTWWEVDW